MESDTEKNLRIEFQKLQQKYQEHMATCEQKGSKVAHLENRINSLQNRDAQWNQHHEQNRVYLAKLEKELKAEKDQVKDLKAQLQVIAASESTLKQKSKDQEVELVNLKNSSQGSPLPRSEKQKLQAEIKALKKALEIQTQKNEGKGLSNIDINNLTDENANLKSQLEKATIALKTNVTKNVELIKTKNTEIDEFKKEITELKLKIQKNDVNNSSKVEKPIVDNSIKEELEKIKAKLQNKELQVKELIQQKKILEVTIAQQNNIEMENNTLKQKINELNKTLSKQKLEENNKQNTNGEIAKNNSNNTKNNAIDKEANETIKKLTIELEKLKVQQRSKGKNGFESPDKHIAKVNELQEQLKKEQMTITNLRNDYLELKKKNDNLEIRLAQLERDRNSLIKKLTKKTAKLEDLHKINSELQANANMDKMQTSLVAGLQFENGQLQEDLRKEKEINTQNNLLIERLINENSSFLQTQRFKKQVDVEISKRDSFELLIKEKQKLCDEIFNKTMYINQLETERDGLKKQLEENVLKPPEDTLPHININHIQDIEPILASNKLPPLSPSTDEKKNPINPLPMKDDNKPNSHKEEFVEVPLSTMYDIDHSLKPADELIVETPKENIGWIAYLWSYVPYVSKTK